MPRRFALSEDAVVDALYIAATVALVAAVSGLGYAYWYFRPAIDEATLCRNNRPILEHTIVMVDHTDRWDDRIGELLAEAIATAQRETSRFEKFSIVSLDPRLDPTPVFSICNPGEPSWITELYRGRKWQQRDFDDRFVGAADRVIAEMQVPGTLTVSPLVEWILDLTSQEDFDDRLPSRRLILVSDMRQNGEDFTFYTPTTDVSEVAAQDAEFVRYAREHLSDRISGVAVEVQFVPTQPEPPNLSEDRMQRVWSDSLQGLAAEFDWQRIR